jgi:N-methylhydantoinase A
MRTPVIQRSDLAIWRVGPLIVEEYDSTCVVPPDAHAALDAGGNIAIDL